MSVNLSRSPGDLTALSALSSSWLTADSTLSTKFLCSSSSAIFIAMHGGGSRSSSLSVAAKNRTGIVSLFESSKKTKKIKRGSISCQPRALLSAIYSNCFPLPARLASVFLLTSSRIQKALIFFFFFFFPSPLW